MRFPCISNRSHWDAIRIINVAGDLSADFVDIETFSIRYRFLHFILWMEEILHHLHNRHLL